MRLANAPAAYDAQDQAQLRREIEAFARKPLALYSESGTTSRLDGTLNVATRIALTGLGSYGSVGAEIYVTAVDGLTIIGKTGSGTDLTVAAGSGNTIFDTPTGAVDFRLYGHLLAAGNATQDVGATAHRFRTVYAQAFSDGTDQILGSSGASLRLGQGSWSEIQVTPPTKFLSTIGFNATNPIAKPAVSGSRAANAALASLCTALAAYGLITNNTVV